MEKTNTDKPQVEVPQNVVYITGTNIVYSEGQTPVVKGYQIIQHDEEKKENSSGCVYLNLEDATEQAAMFEGAIVLECIGYEPKYKLVTYYPRQLSSTGSAEDIPPRNFKQVVIDYTSQTEYPYVYCGRIQKCAEVTKTPESSIKKLVR